MLILSLDTSFNFVNFCLLEGNSLSPLISFGEGENKKALQILPQIFEELKIPIKEIDFFVVNIGVGYSTGLRIGVSMMKTYSQMLERPLITYTSTSALVRFLSFFEYEILIPLLKISRYIVYAVWQKEGNIWKKIEEEKILNAENLKFLLNHYPQGVFLSLEDFPAKVDWEDLIELQKANSSLIDINSLRKRFFQIPLIGGFSNYGALLGAELVLKKEKIKDFHNSIFREVYSVEPLYFRPAC